MAKSHHPVWLNRDVPLYVALLVDGCAYLVLTRKGPILARDAAQHAGKCKCYRSKRVTTPLVAGHIREVEHVLDPDNASLIARKNDLVIWRVILRLEDGRETPVMVWTAKGFGYAVSVAKKALPGSVEVKGFQVRNNLIVCEYLDAETVLKAG